MQHKHPMIRLFTFIKPFSAQFWVSVSATIANTVFDLMPPLLVGWVIDSVSGRPPEWIGWVTDTQDPWALAIFLSILGFLIFGLESFFQWMYQYGFMSLSQKVQHHLRLTTYSHIQDREMAFFENHRLGNTLSILNDDINQLERFMYTGFVELLRLSVVIIFSGYVMFVTSWQLALIGLIPVPFILWASFYYQSIIAPHYNRMRESVGELGSRLENNLSGIVVVKSFTAEQFEYGRVEEASNRYLEKNHEVIKRNARYTPLVRTLVSIGFCGILLIGSYWVLNDAPFLTVGQLVLFSMLIQRVLWPLTRLGTTLDDFERAGASADRVFSLLDAPNSIQDPHTPVDVTPVKGDVQFKAVHFDYRSDIPILNGLDFSVPRGETLGIAGTTGAGKSTLVKLALRLYDPTQGAVCIDGHDLKTLSLRDIRQSIALVSQDVYLFHGSISDNIAYGINGATQDAVEQASISAELHQFVMSLPEGYDTIVGERGIKLSGGQRQRLSIARAILKDAPIMIFDEATSSVDTETERAIQQNINTLTEGKTALVIAHRLSTIRYANRIIVLDQGTVAEEGTHDSLVLNNGHYAELWKTQTNG